MKKNENLNGEAKEASLKELLAAELFLNENYQFRRNVLNGKVEYVIKSKADEVIADSNPAWQPLTQEDLNSIILRAKREDICDGSNPKSDIELFLHSKGFCRSLRICPNGTDRTMWLCFSSVCQDWIQSS